jgi:hypothetical protein
VNIFIAVSKTLVLISGGHTAQIFCGESRWHQDFEPNVRNSAQ